MSEIYILWICQYLELIGKLLKKPYLLLNHKLCKSIVEKAQNYFESKLIIYLLKLNILQLNKLNTYLLILRTLQLIKEFFPIPCEDSIQVQDDLRYNIFLENQMSSPYTIHQRLNHMFCLNHYREENRC